MRKRRVFVVSASISFLMLVWGCSGSEENVGPGSPGTEGSPCPRSGGGCKSGLVCVSNVCVVSEQQQGASSSSSVDGGGNGESDGGGGETSTPDAPFDAAQCKFLHPLVDGGARYCSVEH
jgi:hypothetical protein